MLRENPDKYQPISTKLVQSYMTIRSRMSSIMGLIRPGNLELFALELEKNAISLRLHSSFYKYQLISIKLGQNIYDHKISDEVDCRYSWTKTY